MSIALAHQAETGKTVEFIERFVAPFDSPRELVQAPFVDPLSNATTMIFAARERETPFNFLTRGAQIPISLAFPENQIETSTIIFNYASPINNVSSATTGAELARPLFLPVQNTTALSAGPLGYIETTAVVAANRWLSKARIAALRAHDLRAAYHSVYRGLDVLMRTARWHQVGVELEEICSERYPAEFGIGAMRFVSSASQRIPKWNFILGKLATLAKGQGIDVRRAMRGLVEKNASP